MNSQAQNLGLMKVSVTHFVRVPVKTDERPSKSMLFASAAFYYIALACQTDSEIIRKVEAQHATRHGIAQHRLIVSI